MDLAADNLLLVKHMQDMRDMWQGRALKAARGKTAAVLLSVLSHSYDEGMAVLLRVVFPGFIEPALPCLVSAGRVAKNGAVVADMLGRDGAKHTQVPLYKDEIALRDEFRKLADEVKCTDAEREEMFKVVKRWVVADTRLDPTFDPKDPDAKRLH